MSDLEARVRDWATLKRQLGCTGDANKLDWIAAEIAALAADPKDGENDG